MKFLYERHLPFLTAGSKHFHCGQSTQLNFILSDHNLISLFFILIVQAFSQLSPKLSFYGTVDCKEEEEKK